MCWFFVWVVWPVHLVAMQDLIRSQWMDNRYCTIENIRLEPSSFFVSRGLGSVYVFGGENPKLPIGNRKVTFGPWRSATVIAGACVPLCIFSFFFDGLLLLHRHCFRLCDRFQMNDWAVGKISPRSTCDVRLTGARTQCWVIHAYAFVQKWPCHTNKSGK